MPSIQYELIRSSRKTISITITHDGAVVVRAPLRAPKAQIAGFVEQKHNWIVEKQALVLQRTALHKPREPASGEEFMYLGRKLMLALSDKVASIEIIGETLAFPRAWIPNADAELKHWYQVQAASVLDERLKYWRGTTGITFKAAGLSDARRRWGSCSGKGSLNFTWRLVMAPVEVIDYIVVHELVHMEHLDHSRAFWVRVGEIMPDYKAKEKWLKDNSAILKLF